MRIKKLIGLIGTTAILASLAGFAAADTRYGEAGAEWLAGVQGDNTSSIHTVADINEINESSPSASGKTFNSYDDQEFWTAE